MHMLSKFIHTHLRMYKTKSAFSLMTEEHPLLVAWQSHLFLLTASRIIPPFLYFSDLKHHWVNISFRALMPSSLALLNVKLLRIFFLLFQRS